MEIRTPKVKLSYNLEVGDIIKNVGEVTWIINRTNFHTIVNVYSFESGKIKREVFKRDEEVEVLHVG